ncbi:stress response translation initiation inhibitor YciH [archaeon]|nr:stress response translation initiation inhibitor YciH [archaeon]
MTEVCPKCGLPKDLCVCQEIAKEAQKIKIRTEVKRYRKKMTVVENLEGINLDELAKKLKRRMACGGTVKNKRIELQGAHAEKVKRALIALNYPEDSIEIV